VAAAAMMKLIFIFAVVATVAVMAANETDTAAVIDSAVKSSTERNPTAVMGTHERNPTAVTATQDIKPAANMATKKGTNEDGLLVVRVSETLPLDDCVQTLLDLEVKKYKYRIYEFVIYSATV
jgi:hypothetical protein